MAHQGGGETEGPQRERSDVAEQAVVTDEQLVELATGGEVLVLEDREIGDGRPSVQRLPHPALELRHQGLARGQEAGEGGEPVLQPGGGRRRRAHRAVRSTGPPHVGTGADDAAWATAPDDAVPVARPLLGRGQLGHDRGHDVGQ